MADDDLKRELLRVLQETEETHAQGQAVLKKGLEELQAGQDHGRLAREIVEQGAVDRKHMELLKAAFQARNDETRVFTRGMSESVSHYGVTSQQSSVAVSTSVTFTLTSWPDPRSAEIDALTRRASALFSYTAQSERVRDGLRRCRLDEVLLDVNRSALSLIEESAETVVAPTSPDSSAAVVTLRDGIKRAIVDLFNRCKGQETGKGWEGKLRSIFKRAGRDNLGPTYFETLCQVVHSKVDELADAKDKVTDRLAVLVIYQDRMQFLLAVLDGVDEQKLT